MISSWLSWLLVFVAGSGQVPTVTVEAVLLQAPSAVFSTENPEDLAGRITSQADLVPGEAVYLEVWFRTSGPYGIVVAVLDVVFSGLGTTLDQVTVEPPWSETWGDVFGDTRAVEDGRIIDLGGITMEATGLFWWSKLATIEFDVLGREATICTVSGGAGRGFGMVSIGSVPDDDVAYGCVDLFNVEDLNRDGAVDLEDFASLQKAMTGP